MMNQNIWACAFIFFITFISANRSPLKYSSVLPITKIPKEPILIVTDPISKCRIHLIGVSHGSPASSELVSKTMNSLKPRAVVVELCDDRFFSISLDAKVAPRNNNTLTAIYNEKLKKIESRSKNKISESKSVENGNKITRNFMSNALLANLIGTFKFAKSQGLVGGLFVTLGILVGSIQRLSQASSGDEFVTAMKVAETLKIPVKLGDAPQNDTLKSIRGVISKETFDINECIKGSKALAFSSFGMSAVESNIPLSQHFNQVNKDNNILAVSQWINIPQAYTDNPALLKSLYPLLAVAFLSTCIGFIPSSQPSSVADIASLDQTLTSYNIIINTISTFLISDTADNMFQILDVAVNIFALLLLVRMSKLIGTDRDSIIASKVQAICKEYPNQDIAVVIGMLHCNGVARWILSGLNPLEFTSLNDANNKDTK